MKNKLLAPYDWFLIVGIISVNLIYNILADEVDILGSVAGIAGVLCVVLVAKGSILNYLFGLVNVSLYAYISFEATAYGDAALNALYYLPMQFIGYFAWKRRVDDTQVKARRLTLLQRLFVAVGCAVAVVAVAFILKSFGAGQPFKDSATTVLSVVAQILMAMAFMEQWVLWIMTNIISVIMWVIFALEGEPHAEMMVIMWVFYLMNSINGLRVWLKLSDGSEA
jgi:nicotinamide mononucleotide transporter